MDGINESPGTLERRLKATSKKAGNLTCRIPNKGHVPDRDGPSKSGIGNRIPSPGYDPQFMTPSYFSLPQSIESTRNEFLKEWGERSFINGSNSDIQITICSWITPEIPQTNVLTDEKVGSGNIQAMSASEFETDCLQQFQSRVWKMVPCNHGIPSITPDHEIAPSAVLAYNNCNIPSLQPLCHPTSWK